MEGTEARFPLGRVVSTPGAKEALDRTSADVRALLKRHRRGDWGVVSEHDAKENEYSVSRHLRILSAYRLSDDTKIWLITEADRSVTTFLLPSEY